VEALKEAGVDEVIVYCVNDAACMGAWSKDQGVSDVDFINFMGDPTSAVTTALDMELKELGEGQAEVDGLFGPFYMGLYKRCKRFAMYIKDGEIVLTKVAQALSDPAGDDFPEATLAEALLADIKAL
jgi:peroxiredoxin